MGPGHPVAPQAPPPGPLPGTPGLQAVALHRRTQNRRSRTFVPSAPPPPPRTPAHSPTAHRRRLIANRRPCQSPPNVRPPPPHTLPPSSAPPPLPNGGWGWTAVGSWQSSPFHTPPSSLPLSRTGTSPPPQTPSCHKCFVNNSCRRPTGLSVAAVRCEAVRRCQRGTQLGRRLATGWSSFYVGRALTRYGGGARPHYISLSMCKSLL